MQKSTKKKAAELSAKIVRIISRPTIVELQLDSKKQKAINEYFAWEERSAEKEFIVGQPMCTR